MAAIALMVQDRRLLTGLCGGNGGAHILKWKNSADNAKAKQGKGQHGGCLEISILWVPLFSTDLYGRSSCGCGARLWCQRTEEVFSPHGA